MPDWFVRGLAPPDQRVTTIAVSGRKVATVWTWFSAGNRELVVNAAVSLVKDDIFDRLFAGIKKLADLGGADRIAFSTMRRGLVCKAQADRLSAHRASAGENHHSNFVKLPHENFEIALCLCLAQTLLLEARERWSPNGIVDDAMCNLGFAPSNSQADTSNEAVGGEGAAGAGSPTVIAGAGSASAGATAGQNIVSGQGHITDSYGGTVASGGSETINVTSSDLAALQSNQAVSEAALASNTSVVQDSLDAVGEVALGAETVAANSIAAGVAETAANNSFGEQALQFAANAQSTDTTALEQEAANFAAGVSTLGNNALAAAQNETLAGITPGQAYESAGISTQMGSSNTWQTWAAVVAVVAGVFTLFHYLKK